MLIPAALAGIILLSPVPDACSEYATSVLVDTNAHLMRLCLRGRAMRELRVAIGGGGVGKRREGDGKVPLGAYRLGRAQASASYTLFIPIGYPTEEQRKAGYTGSAVGVHGPPGNLEGPLATSVDWTLGCIAVGTVQEIRDVAKWVSTHEVDRIVIK